MNLIDRLHSLRKLIEKQMVDIITEEATKDVLVVPFIRALGYDISDLGEVMPDFAVDIGCAKKKIVDYAVCRDGKPVLLFDCKATNVFLSEEHVQQLKDIFDVTSARIGVLTNGISYHFYTDSEVKSVMDSKPFIELNLLNIDEQIFSELTKLSKKTFDLDQIFTAASELRYIRAIKSILLEEASSPSLELIGYFANQVHPGKITDQILDQLAPIVKEAFNQFVNDRLKSVKKDEAEQVFEDYGTGKKNCGIETCKDRVITDEEFEGFFVVNVA